MQWVLIGLAVFVVWQVIQDGQKYETPVGPVAGPAAMPGGANIPFSQWLGSSNVESAGPAYQTGPSPWNPTPLSQAALMAMPDAEIAGLAVWSGGEEARAESERRGFRFTYAQWHAFKSAAQGRDGSNDADLRALGQSANLLTAAEFQAVDLAWTSAHAIGA